MQQPSGFERKGSNGTFLACRLNKALYGLKQASREWYATPKVYLIFIDYQRIEIDHSVFTHENGIIIAVYTHPRTRYIRYSSSEAAICRTLSNERSWLNRLVFKGSLVLNPLLKLSMNVLLKLALMMHRCFGGAAIAHTQKLNDSLDVCSMVDPKGSFSPITIYVHT